jgi:hypothetical protein
MTKMLATTFVLAPQTASKRLCQMPTLQLEIFGRKIQWNTREGQVNHLKIAEMYRRVTERK